MLRSRTFEVQQPSYGWTDLVRDRPRMGRQPCERKEDRCGVRVHGLRCRFDCASSAVFLFFLRAPEFGDELVLALRVWSSRRKAASERGADGRRRDEMQREKENKTRNENRRGKRPDVQDGLTG
jgi:hypothetical protein